jgi:hypothetical protein
MFEFLAGIVSVIFENAYVFESGITFQVLDALSRQQEEPFDLTIGRIPQLPVMANIFHQELVCTHRRHAVVNPVRAPGGFAFDAVQGSGVNHRPRRPRIAAEARHMGNQLSRRR